MRRLVLVWCLVLCVPPALDAAPADLGLQVPDGFAVSLFAGDELAHDIYSMTIDSQGRVVVSGRGYVKILHDDDQDGRADRATLFSSVPKTGCHGMFFDGPHLICTGDGGLWRIPDENEDGEADGEPEMLAPMRDPEHGANGVVKGPDGWYYVICGNDARINEQHANTPGSPVKKPQSGALVRIRPDGRESEVVAHGFRNPYDLDFNAKGHIFTVDSDGERDHHLPWYAPTRLFDIYPGMHHGWVLNGWQRSWSRPQTFFDNVPRLVEIGRGSPTGLTVYRHTAFPQKYRGGVFSCCWTLGRVYFLPLTSTGSTFTSSREVFLQTTGEIGFAPVDIAVGARGELYVAIGGRRTRGGVFRIEAATDQLEEKATSHLDQVLMAPQPLASWSRAQWEPLVKQLSEKELMDAVADDLVSVEARVRAVEVLTEYFHEPKLSWKLETLSQYPIEVAARIAWSLGRRPYRVASAVQLAQLTHDSRPAVARAAFEAVANLPVYAGDLEAANWNAIDESTDRAVRAAAILAEGRRGDEAPKLKLSALAQLWIKHFRGKLVADDFGTAAKEYLRFAQWPRNATAALEAIRLMELCLGDINTDDVKESAVSGYALRADAETIARVSRRYHTALVETFGETEWQVDYELARLYAMLGINDVQLSERLITSKCTYESETADDIHFLIVLSLLPGRRNEKTTRHTALTLANLQAKMRNRREFSSRNWPDRVLETFEKLLERDPELGPALLKTGEFSQPYNALFVTKLQPEERLAATRLMLQRGQQVEDDENRWNASLVSLAGDLPADEAYPALRNAWEDFGLRDEVIKQLARQPHNEDRPRFVKALGSVNPQTVMTACQALLQLDLKDSDADLAAAAAALRQACTTPDYINVRRNIVKLLSAWTEEAFAIVEPTQLPLLAAYQPVFDWLAKHRPEAWQRVAALGGPSLNEWKTQLEQVDWSAGIAERGKLAFQKRSCIKCHAGTSPLGPDLAGAAARFSREDLFAAILDPSKDVAPLYQTTQVITRSGRMVNGLVVYESPDSTLIQTDPETTVRIAGDEIQLLKKSRQSLMPTGLLNGAEADELADLYAYLRTLTGKR